MPILNADSDSSGDLRELIGHVLDSDVVVLLQSKEVLFCPRCLLELYAATTAGIPIVSLVCSGKGYDSTAAEDHLLHLDTSLPAANPSAVGVLDEHEAPVLRVAHVLWACLPSAISVPLNSSGSENAIRAAVADLVKAMQRAKAGLAPLDGEAWRESREAWDRAVVAEVVASSRMRETQREWMLQRIERVGALERDVAEGKAARKQEVAELSAKLAAREAEHRALAAAQTARIAELTNKLS